VLQFRLEVDHGEMPQTVEEQNMSLSKKAKFATLSLSVHMRDIVWKRLAVVAADVICDVGVQLGC